MPCGSPFYSAAHFKILTGITNRVKGKLTPPVYHENLSNALNKPNLAKITLLVG
jgi:hypothetical protein